MTKKIHKYKLNGISEIIKLPEDIEVLKVEYQDKELYLWGLIDIDKPLIKRAIFIYGTGYEINDVEKLTYLDTVFDGAYVWHVFINKTEKDYFKELMQIL